DPAAPEGPAAFRPRARVTGRIASMGSGAFPAARASRCGPVLAGLALALLSGACPQAEPAPEPEGNAAVVTLYAVRGDARRLIGTGFLAAPGVLVTAYHVARAGAFASP